jgi:hypothetical protein
MDSNICADSANEISAFIRVYPWFQIKKTNYGGIMGNLRKLKDLVQELVEKGATSVEEVHKSIAALPLEVLESIEGLEEPAKGIKEIQQKTIGGVYDIIRQVNTKVAEIAEEIINKVEPKEDEED